MEPGPLEDISARVPRSPAAPPHCGNQRPESVACTCCERHIEPAPGVDAGLGAPSPSQTLVPPRLGQGAAVGSEGQMLAREVEGGGIYPPSRPYINVMCPENPTLEALCPFTLHHHHKQNILNMKVMMVKSLQAASYQCVIDLSSLPHQPQSYRTSYMQHQH